MFGFLRRGGFYYQSIVCLLLPLALMFVSYMHLFHGYMKNWPNGNVIWGIDSGLALLLVFCAFELPWPLPNKPLALIMVPALFLTLVMCFADLYIASQKVVRVTPPPENQAELLTQPWDAAYFSLLTMTTLGYGDYTPQDQPTRKIVVGELLSGALLLLFTFPVLASRLAMFDSSSGIETVITVQHGADGKWKVREDGGSARDHGSGSSLKITVHAKPTIEKVE